MQKYILIYVIPFLLFAQSLFDPHTERASLLTISKEIFLYDKEYLNMRFQAYNQQVPNDYYIIFRYSSFITNNIDEELSLYNKIIKAMQIEGYENIEWLYATLYGARLALEPYILSEIEFNRKLTEFNDLLKTFKSRKIYNHTLPLESIQGLCPSSEMWKEIMKLDIQDSNFLNSEKPVNYVLKSHFFFALIGNCENESKNILDAISKNLKEKDNHTYLKMLENIILIDRKLFKEKNLDSNNKEYQDILNLMIKENYHEWLKNSIKLRIGFICGINSELCTEPAKNYLQDYNVFGKKKSYFNGIILESINKIKVNK